MPVPCRSLSPVGTALPGRRVACWRAGGRARLVLRTALGDAGAQRHRERELRAALRRAGPAGDPRVGGRGLRVASPLSQVAPGCGRPPPAAECRPWAWEDAHGAAPAAAVEP